LFDSAALEKCGPICLRDIYGLEARTVGAYTLSQIALRGQGILIDPGAPQDLTLEGLDLSEATTYCPE
jgi:hypothetical protein